MEKIFSERLRLARKGQNQSEAAEKLGISQVRLSNYERGEREPDLSVLKKIASGYNVSLDWLMGLSDTRTPTIPQPIGVPDYEKLAKQAADQAEKDAAAFFAGMPKIPAEESVPVAPPAPRGAGAFIAKRKDGHLVRRYRFEVPQPPPIAGLTDDDLERLVSLVADRVLSRLRRESLHHRRKA